MADTASLFEYQPALAFVSRCQGIRPQFLFPSFD
jgi:hypothetical protein